MLKGDWEAPCSEREVRAIKLEAWGLAGLQAICLLLAVMALASCEDESGPRQWDAFVYPDARDLTEHIEVRGFKTFELCRDAATSLLRQLDMPEGTYECGYRCTAKPEWGGMKICEETRD